MIGQCQTETEQTSIAAIGAVNGFDPIVLQGDAAQIDDPQVGQETCDHQIVQALRIGSESR